MKITFLALVFAVIWAEAESENCACATVDVHIRSGAGVSHAILDTLSNGKCLRYFGNEVGSSQWAHVEFNGKDGYISDGYLKFQSCTLSSQCACATGNVHVRSGAGTSHGVIGMLTPGSCYTYKGDHSQAGSLDWAHIDFKGQNGWVAMNWLNIKPCSGSTGSSSNQQLSGCPKIVSRSSWGARAPNANIQNLPSTPQNVYIHHGSSSRCHNEAECEKILREWQTYHMDQHGMDDIGYSFVIGEDGNVYASRGWDKVGGHTDNHNTDGLGFCVIGDFTDQAPNKLALDALKQLIQCGVSNGKIRSDYILYGHRDVKPSTTCPGQKFYELIQTWPHYKTSR